MSRTVETKSPVLKALLVGIQLPKVHEDNVRYSLEELRRLVNTMGYEVVGTTRQKRRSTEEPLVVGEGKLKELAKWGGGTGVVASAVKRKPTKAQLREMEADEDAGEEDELEEDFELQDGEESELSDAEADLEPEVDSSTGEPIGHADVIIFDCELSPSQMRNLESATGATILDRTGVIIEIFSRHARTRASRLQVEIARLTYLAPRIRETGSGPSDRSGGGIGGKGSGESSQELDRRNIRDRIKELKQELDSVQDEGAIRRNRRLEENAVALVGYTNAGKSSLMRAMTGSDVLVADKLFATLDTTVRPMYPDSVPRILLSDTVGFIKKLPHDLVASFKSTLEEALNADLLLFVVDAADPTFREQLEVTRQVLGEIGALETSSQLILNKRDKLSAEEIEKLRLEFPDGIFLSTRDKGDLAMLRENLLSFFEEGMTEEVLNVPYTAQGAVGEIRRTLRVLDETYTGQGVSYKVKGKPRELARIKEKFKLPT